MIRVHPANAAYDLNTGFKGTKGIALSHVQLCATAELAREFVERRLEKHLTKMRARKFEAIQFATEFFRVNPRGTENFERPGRAAPLGNVCAFEQAHSGINRSGNECRHIGRRHNPK